MKRTVTGYLTPSMRHAEHHLPNDLDAPAQSRRLVEGWTRNHPRRHEIVLAVSELVANAVTHGSQHSPGAGVTLSIVTDDTCLRVGVAQRSPPFQPEFAGPIGEPRGLTIVDRGVDRWGIDERGDVVEVWFEVDDPRATGPATGVPATGVPATGDPATGRFR